MRAGLSAFGVVPFEEESADAAQGESIAEYATMLRTILAALNRLTFNNQAEVKLGPVRALSPHPYI